MFLRRRATGSSLLTISRGYHDNSYGYREARKFSLPDYSSSQLENRTVNAPLLRYIDSVRTHGHRAARIDPLDLLQREEVAALDPARYGLTDPSRTYDINGIVWTHPVGTPKGSESTHRSLKDITQHMRDIYVGRIAYEYMHSPSKKERLWFSHLLESEEARAVHESHESKRRIHSLLARSEALDQFLQAKFPNLKRYGLEGGESMLPALDALFRTASQAGMENIVLGMPHRGRLNLLTGLLEYSPQALFHKIKGGSEIPSEIGATGDVISHLVSSPILQYDGAEKPINVSLLPNPSHLEAVGPVALGKARAKQFAMYKSLNIDPSECFPGDKVMCVQLHGDASFTGQGVVMEMLSLSNLPHYTVGGTVHIVVNNSVGYTTPASGTRSSLYCSDIGKMINAPVLHVNGDHPEEVARAVEIAFKYRNYFRKDIIIDLIVYRRWGHNELDEPAFTQPLMYSKIRSRSSVPTLYESQLISENVITKEEAASLRSSYKSYLTEQLAQADAYKPTLEHADMLKEQWQGMVWPASKEAVHDPQTGVNLTTLKEVGRASVDVPEGFELHSRLQRHVKPRLDALESGKGIDWATAEALAWGSLMLEGCDVRISGQDVGRGTFSQRHAMFVDQKTEGVVVPLNNSLKSEGRLELANSSLSEMAVLGFEYGVSWERPNILPIWEAQFGDFFNGAQVIIDTFITSSQTKWLKQSGLVMLLPHGLDGGGPEHSTCRIERFLQLANDRYNPDLPQATDLNMHIVNPTTPAQYFHLLRRQIRRNYRKPLIVAGPKTLLRLPAATSNLSELEPDGRFQPVLDHPTSDPASVHRVVVVSGKIYYDLAKKLQSLSPEIASRVALIRVEELCPFPFEVLQAVLERYVSANYVWLQEEPKNQGAWTHVEPRINKILANIGYDKGIEYRGREELAVPVTGIGSHYAIQQKKLIEDAFAGL